MKALFEKFEIWVLHRQGWEIILLAIFFFCAALFVVSPLFDHSLVHTFPIGYGAKDAYWHLAYEERILIDGNYINTPSDLVQGNSGLVAIQPPWLYYSIASISSSLGIMPWDVNQVFLLGLMVLGMLLVYGLLRRVHVVAAVFSLPLMMFIFSFPFLAGFSWGQHLYIAGMFFLMLSVALVLQFGVVERKWIIMILLGLSVGALNLVHPSELIYFVAICALIGISWLVHRRWKDIFFALGGVVIGILISIGYLAIFSQTWIADGSDPIRFNHIIHSDNFGPATIHYTHFDGWWWAILVGVLLCGIAFVRNKPHAELYAAFIGFFLIGFGTYLNQWRAYQYRFLWPIVLAFFVGIVFYQLYLMVMKNQSSRTQIGVVVVAFSLLLVLSFSHISKGTFNPPASLGPVSLYGEEDIKLIQFAQSKVDKGEEVLFYEPGTQGEKAYWMLYGVRAFQVQPQQSIQQLMDGNTSSEMLVNPVCEGTNYRYNESLGYVVARDVVTSCAASVRSVCSFPHVVLLLRRIPPEAVGTIQAIFSHDGFVVEYSEPGLVFITNSKVRARCDDVIN